MSVISPKSFPCTINTVKISCCFFRSKSYCTRFVEFIADQCTRFWEGLIDLIHRIRSCFCRSAPTEQPLPGSLAPEAKVAPFFPPSLPNSIPSSSTTQTQEHSSSSAKLSSDPRKTQRRAAEYAEFGRRIFHHRGTESTEKLRRGAACCAPYIFSAASASRR